MVIVKQKLNVRISEIYANLHSSMVIVKLLNESGEDYSNMYLHSSMVIVKP